MKISLQGARDLDRALSDLTRAAAKGVARRALKKAAEPMRAAAEGDAPERKGKLKAAIQTSGRAKGGNAGAQAFGAALRAGMSSADARQAARAANREASGSVILYMGVTSDVGQGVLQEFGTAHHAAQPFMRPAWDANKQGALQTIMDELRIEIDKSVARAARKAARDAAKLRGR